MSKRKLNKQQQSRIAHQHSQRIESINTKNLQQGLVITHFGKELEILNLNNSETDKTTRCHIRANLQPIVCGDRVLWQKPEQHTETGIVEVLIDRNSVIERPRPYHDPKPIAANIDQIVLVFAMNPPPIVNLLDRYLVAAENAGIKITIVLNKSDLLITENTDTKIKEEINNLVALYQDLGYPVFKISCKENKASESTTLQEIFSNKTSIIVGQSGVGKSSIINQLCVHTNAETGDVSDANAKGKHTTTTAKMYFIDNAIIEKGAIIDSPGIRDFALWHLSQEDIIDGLIEFRQFANNCKYRNCEHGVSEGCAIQAAINNGDIHPYRIASYQHILNSIQDYMNSKN